MLLLVWLLVSGLILHSCDLIDESRHEKTSLRGFRPGKTQTSLLSYSDQLESWNSGFSKYRYYIICVANNKGADQTARMRRLICTFVVRIWLKQVFSWHGSDDTCTSLTLTFSLSFEPPHDKTNKMTCAPIEDSDQPGRLPSLITVFTVHSVGS